MRNLCYLLVMVYSALALGGTGAASDDRPGDRKVLDDLLAAHNRERAAAKLPPLKADTKLERAASAHARDMAEHSRLSHQGSDGSAPAQRVKRQHYPCQACGENIAEGATTVKDVMRVWMKSPEHKKNILGKYSEMGAARVQDEGGVWYWCVDFGLPWPSYEPERAAADLVEAMNREREKAKRPPLKANDILSAAARRHARDMAARGQLGPKDEDGMTPFDRVLKEGYRLRKITEQSASGESTPDALIRAWLDDPSRRELLLGEFGDVGVGYALSDGGKPFWSVLLAQPEKE